MSSTGHSKSQSAAKFSAREHTGSDHNRSKENLDIQNIWQHPYVDVFKHFKLAPTQDWKLNKKSGDVTEIVANEIGRKALSLNGTISANNYVQIPHPSCAVKSLDLTGRYLYLQVKAPLSGSPFSFHIDFKLNEKGLGERPQGTGLRLSASNLYKTMSTQNGYSLQVPLNLDVNRWTVVVFDIYDLLKVSGLLPPNYMIQGCYVIKQIMMCSCSIVRGIYTSENLYDFVTLPPELRFKFSFKLQDWPQQFAWLELPQDLKIDGDETEMQLQRIEQTKARAALVSQNHGNVLTNRQKAQMDAEINERLNARRQAYLQQPVRVDSKPIQNEKRLKEIQESLNMNIPYGGNDILSADEQLGFNSQNPNSYNNGIPDQARTTGQLPYQTGQYVGADNRRSAKLNLDPMIELKHVIGYSPRNCLNIKWSRVKGENVVIYTSGGILIALDIESNEQKKFFFGHSAPIVCFDVSQNGQIIASAQEGKNSDSTPEKPLEDKQQSVIRIWDYATARCISMLVMPVLMLRQIAFSHDGRYLACVGKDTYQKNERQAKYYGEQNIPKITYEKTIIIIWDISRIRTDGKPEIVAKQTSEFPISSLKFSPVDNTRLVSCGKENIRFWRVKESNNIRGSAVQLNHHARGTYFTSLDFQWSARAAANLAATGDSADELERIFVASKHGMIFQINYQTEILEATYRTNESEIYTIAVNENYCVTGSQDQYLRVWRLDFSEFLMEAKHDEAVCQVEISADGLRVVCGTTNGCLGFLDKQNHRYRTLIRSHTNSILSMDFHVPKRYIITISTDCTIRLWDMENYDQAVEFNFKKEDPILCVAAHPTLPIFSCGFTSGKMGVFDIVNYKLADEFVQFQKPIRKIKYSQNGDLLVTCCEDGSIALHNARRHHQPTKMMHLEFPPKYIHIAFSPITRQSTIRFHKQQQSVNVHDQHSDNYDADDAENKNYSNMDDENSEQTDQITEDGETLNVSESLFGIMGEYGNNLMIYDTESIILKHQIQAGYVLRSFEFNKNATEVVLVTDDLRIRFHSLVKFEGVFLRELQTVHRGSINSIDLSLNGGFMLTGGEDNLIKIWDYEAQKSVPYYFQAFIGHTYPITDVMFNPCDNNTIISTADKDGIYIWQFHGDTHTNCFPESNEDEIEHATQIQQINDKNFMHQPTVLERMRMSVMEKKKPKLQEFSFIVPPFQPIETLNIHLQGQYIGKHTIENNQVDLKDVYDQEAFSKKLTFNHFISMQNHSNFAVEVEKKPLAFDQQSEGQTLTSSIVNGYDGFGGAHDNLLWNSQTGSVIYTLNNKVIKEHIKMRTQTVFAESTVRLSCIDMTEDGKIVAAAEGEENSTGFSLIHLIDLESNKPLGKLKHHRKGVQSMAFADKGKILISIGVFEENIVVVWNVEKRQPYDSVELVGYATNKVLVQPIPQGQIDFDENSVIKFFTVGNQGHLTYWQFDSMQERPEIQFCDIEKPSGSPMNEVDFVTASFMPIYEKPLSGSENKKNAQIGKVKDYALILGTSDGQIAAFNTSSLVWLQGGQLFRILEGQIGSISAKYNWIVVADSLGRIVKYSTSEGKIEPPDDPKKIMCQRAESAITAMVMDEKNDEGILGTSLGNIYYLGMTPPTKDGENKEPVLIRLVTRASSSLDLIQTVKFDPTNQAVFLSSSGSNSGEVKLYTTETLDQVVNFPQNSFGPLRFISCPLQKNKKQKIVGHSCGVLKLINLDFLKVDGLFQMNLEEGEELTCGDWNTSCMNFAVGTNFGTVYFGNYKKDMHNRQTINMARLVGLSKTKDHAVTSIQLSSFEPNGCLLVAFSNGQVRTWQSTYSSENDGKLKKTLKKTATDIADLGQVQFNIVDKFDMFRKDTISNNGFDSINDEDDRQLYEDVGVSLSEFQLIQHQNYPYCEAIFAPGTQSVDQFFSYVSGLQQLFLRSYTQRATLRVLNLGYSPTCMCISDFSKVSTACNITGMIGGALQALVGVGTKEGKVLIYKCDSAQDSLICKTKSGLAFGSIGSITISELAQQKIPMVVSSESGEIISFTLQEQIVAWNSLLSNAKK